MRRSVGDQVLFSTPQPGRSFSRQSRTRGRGSAALLHGPDAQTVDAALVLREARIIIQAEFAQFASGEPLRDGSSPVVIFVYVEDVDRGVEMTSAAGGSVLRPAQDQFWGDRSARIMGP